MAITPSVLSSRIPMLYTDYATNGSLSANEHNALMHETKEIQDYVIRNSNLLGVANVMDYGVVGNGSTNDTTNLQAAINNSDGRVLIMIPSKLKCLITGTILVPANRVLIGGMGLRYSMGSWLTPGEDMVTIVSAGTFPLVQLTGGVNGSGGGIHGLCLSNVNSNTPDVIGLKVDSNGAWMSDGYIDNVWFLRTKFVANMMQGFTCRDNVFDASSGNMMEIYRGENNWITNNRTCIPGLINASSVGLYMGAYNGNPCMGNIVANNTFDNAGMTVGGNGSMGVHLASAVGTAITGNMIGFNNIGIKISSASNSTTITGNVFQGNSAEGVLIDGSDSCIINSNTFDPLYRTGTAQTNTPYVKTLNSASRIIVTNNLMKSNVRTYGVEFSTGTTKSLIDNLVVNGISNPINDLGGNTIGTVIS